MSQASLRETFMPLHLLCTCGARFTLDDGYSGREVLCPECQAPLQAPETDTPIPRRSKLALFSLILSLVGAFTVVGTSIAALLGLIAALRIVRQRATLAGLPYALAGMVLGVGLTLLTLWVITGDSLRNLASLYREALLADQLDLPKDLEIRRADRGFVLQRPDATWGIARRGRLDDEFVDALRFQRSAEVLLVQPGRSLFVDVRRDSIDRKVGMLAIQSGYLDRMRQTSARDDWDEPGPWGGRRWNRRWDNGKDGPPRWDPQEAEEALDSSRPPPLELTSVSELGSREILVRDEQDQVVPESSGLEMGAIVEMRSRTWRLLIRFYRVADRVYIVRGYCPSNRFTPATETELREVLDSFRVLR